MSDTLSPQMPLLATTILSPGSSRLAITAWWCGGGAWWWWWWWCGVYVWAGGLSELTLWKVGGGDALAALQQETRDERRIRGVAVAHGPGRCTAL